MRITNDLRIQIFTSWLNSQGYAPVLAQQIRDVSALWERIARVTWLDKADFYDKLKELPFDEGIRLVNGGNYPTFGIPVVAIKARIAGLKGTNHSLEILPPWNRFNYLPPQLTMEEYWRLLPGGPINRLSPEYYPKALMAGSDTYRLRHVYDGSMEDQPDFRPDFPRDHFDEWKAEQKAWYRVPNQQMSRTRFGFDNPSDETVAAWTQIQKFAKAEGETVFDELAEIFKRYIKQKAAFHQACLGLRDLLLSASSDTALLKMAPELEPYIPNAPVTALTVTNAKFLSAVDALKREGIPPVTS